MTWLLRRATADDLAAVMAIEESTFAADAWPAQVMADELVAPHVYYLVAARADDPGVIDGYAGLRAPLRSTDGDIQTIAVAPPARRRGLGRTLMLQLLNEARQRGIEQVFLDVRADNPGAQALYERLGFEHITVRRGYYQPDGVDANVMRLRVPEPTLQPTAQPTAQPLQASTERSSVGAGVAESLRDAHGSSALVLGIETSCDETGVGIVRGNHLLANVIASSMDEHARYGGVVPEIAARAHLEALTPALQAALDEAGVTLEQLDAIAVTSGPGLSGALMVGVGAAKALAVALDKPLYAVNHLVGHVGADILSPDGGDVEYPTIALLVSGGHTSLLLVRDLISDVELLGETIDDAAGEAFDKVARLLGLPYPGGPQIDALPI